jgi:hypothetical protein
MASAATALHAMHMVCYTACMVFPPPKAPARHDAPLFTRLGDEPIGRTRNLSMTGVFLETDVRPPVGSRDDLTIAWGEGVVSCAVRVVRHAADGIGLAFEDPDSAFSQAVQEILSETPRVPGAGLPRPPQ